MSRQVKIQTSGRTTINDVLCKIKDLQLEAKPKGLPQKIRPLKLSKQCADRPEATVPSNTPQRNALALKPRSQASIQAPKKKLAKPGKSLDRLVYRQSKAGRSSESSYREHLFQTFQSLKFIRTLGPMDPGQLQAKTVHLQRRAGWEGKKTLVLDLDETLVHCLDSVQNSPDVVLQIPFGNGVVLPAGLNIRPFVRDCLREVNKLYEVIVFTASQQCYADAVLNYLDPTGEFIHHRLYRESCIPVRGVLMKDLRVLAGRELKNIVIVDNATYSFGYQLDNGVPIVSWYDDYADRELLNLIEYLRALAGADDVREVNSRTFKLRSFYEDYMKDCAERRGVSRSPIFRRV